MLVLSRKKNEQIVIRDEEVVITVVDIRGDKVRIGIAAHTDTPVHRREVYDAIKRTEAAQAREENPLDGLRGGEGVL